MSTATEASVASAGDDPTSPACELFVVLPSLNDAETLKTRIRKTHDSIRSFGICGEVVIADNGSTDGS